jgi:hypothetical protein
MCFSNELSIVRQARGCKACSADTANVMQLDFHTSEPQQSSLVADDFMTRAKGEIDSPCDMVSEGKLIIILIVLDPVLDQLLFEAVLNGNPPPELSPDEEKKILEILSLAEQNEWRGSSAVKPAYCFWIWCGLKPYRWAVVLDQKLWTEFTEEFQIFKYKGQCNHRIKREKERINYSFYLLCVRT